MFGVRAVGRRGAGWRLAVCDLQPKTGNRGGRLLRCPSCIMHASAQKKKEEARQATSTGCFFFVLLCTSVATSATLWLVHEVPTDGRRGRWVTVARCSAQVRWPPSDPAQSSRPKTGTTGSTCPQPGDICNGRGPRFAMASVRLLKSRSAERPMDGQE